MEHYETQPPTKQPTTMTITHGLKGWKLKNPTTVPTAESIEGVDKAVHTYIVNSLYRQLPKLIPMALSNRSIIEMAKYYLRHATGSASTLVNYIYSVDRFCRWCGKTPDELIAECKDPTGVPDPKVLHHHTTLLDDFVGHLQSQKLSPNYVAGLVKGVKMLHLRNGLNLSYPYRLSTRLKYRDRAPTPEELQRIMDIADIRERVVVSCLALGGFRQGTLSKLRIYHIQRDLERGIIPIHVHVESEITKGKYNDFDTFLGREAVDYIKAYLDLRRRGTPRGHIPPEEIHDDSPLIRNRWSKQVKPVTSDSIYRIVHNLYLKAGLIKERRGIRYQLRPHSIRKFFRTQLAALGVDRDYIEFMMGHTVSTYHDIQMKGVEFLRNVYIASGLSIRPKTQVSKIDALKEIVRAWGMNPEEILTRQALATPHRTYARPTDQITELRKALKDMMRKELLKQ